MSAPTILIVDDNLIIRRLVRATLEAEGYIVVEAPDGQAASDLMANSPPDLVLQDLLLPDIEGRDLVHRLHALPGCADIPIIAFSGFLPQEEQARSLQAGFADYLFKPVEPAVLVQTVKAHLSTAHLTIEKSDRGHLILIADDDPVQRKLLELQLQHLGFGVLAAADGLAALAQARSSRPDVIVSDILMPQLDGFHLCLAVRREPSLAHIPVVLVSAAFTEQADLEVAQAVGASELVLRTADVGPIIKAVRSALRLTAVPPTPTARLPLERYTQRLISQLERQANLNASLASRLSMLEARFAIVGTFESFLQEAASEQAMVDQIAERALNAFALSKGLAYLLDSSGQLTMAAHLGYPGIPHEELSSFFGHVGLLLELTAEGAPVALPSARISPDRCRALLQRSGAHSMLIAPLVLRDECLGVLVMASTEQELGEDWLLFARSIGGSAAQALGLARALNRVRHNEELLSRLVETIPDGILMYRDGHVRLANAAMEHLVGFPGGLVGRNFDEITAAVVSIGDIPVQGAEHPYQRVLRTGEVVRNSEVVRRNPDGEELVLSINAAPLRDSQGQIEGVVASLSDVTERKRAEKEISELTRDLERRVAERTEALHAANEAVMRETTTLAAVMGSMSDGLLLVDDGKSIRYANKRAVELLGLQPEQTFTGSVEAVWEQLGDRLLEGDSVRLSWEQAMANPREFGLFEIALAGPERRDLQLHFFTVDGGIDGVGSLGVVLRDVTAERDLARTKDELVSVVSHEVRTPLASLLGFTELLLERKVSESQRQLYLTTMRDEGQRLTALINDFLDLQRMEAGKVSIEPAALDPLDLLKRAALSVEEDSDHPVVLDAAEGLPTVWAEGNAVQQVLGNLISNARKYSPGGGEVRLTAREVDGTVELSVRDQGLGIPAEALPKLFEKFYRVDNSDRREIKGTGLGLAISRRIVEAHGGRIWAESAGPGQGSRFAFTLPLADAASGADAGSRSKKQIAVESLEGGAA